MGKKTMKLPFFLSSKMNTTNADSSSPSSSSWPWPAYCQQPRTLSFRAGDNVFKTLNSVYNSSDTTPPHDSCFTKSSESPSSSTTSLESSTGPAGGGESVESVIRGLRSDRLFFKPGETKSILEEAKIKGAKLREDEIEIESEFSVIKESVVMSMDSEDPYVDFKKSMEEMVEAHGLKDWESLEELLSCYLKVNGKNNHGFIIGAFVDLLVSLAFASSSSSSSCSSSATTTTCCSSRLSPSSPLSFYTSSNFSDDSSSTPCISSLEEEDEEADDDEIKNN